MTLQFNRHSEERSDEESVLNKIVDSSFRSAAFRMTADVIVRN